jgi:hypothetical protein
MCTARPCWNRWPDKFAKKTAHVDRAEWPAHSAEWPARIAAE